jgi:hypothetical protein
MVRRDCGIYVGLGARGVEVGFFVFGGGVRFHVEHKTGGTDLEK